MAQFDSCWSIRAHWAKIINCSYQFVRQRLCKTRELNRSKQLYKSIFSVIWRVYDHWLLICLHKTILFATCNKKLKSTLNCFLCSGVFSAKFIFHNDRNFLRLISNSIIYYELWLISTLRGCLSKCAFHQTSLKFRFRSVVSRYTSTLHSSSFMYRCKRVNVLLKGIKLKTRKYFNWQTVIDLNITRLVF